MKSTIAFVVSVILGISFCLFFEVRTDHGFICRDTLSLHQYTEWIGGFRTGDHYTISPLQSFLEKTDPAAVTHDWVSFNGTSKNLLGQSMMFAHGDPGSIMLLRPWMYPVIAGLSDSEKTELITTLKSRDEKAIRTAADALLQKRLIN